MVRAFSFRRLRSLPPSHPPKIPRSRRDSELPPTSRHRTEPGSSAPLRRLVLSGPSTPPEPCTPLRTFAAGGSSVPPPPPGDLILTSHDDRYGRQPDTEGIRRLRFCLLPRSRFRPMHGGAEIFRSAGFPRDPPPPPGAGHERPRCPQRGPFPGRSRRGGGCAVLGSCGQECLGYRLASSPRNFG